MTLQTEHSVNKRIVSLSLKQFTGTISFRSKFKGEKDDLDIEQLLVESTSGDIDIDCNGWVKNITEKPQWLAHVNNLSLSAQTIGFISENLKGTRFTHTSGHNGCV